MDNTPEQTAKELMEAKVSLKTYQSLQDRRLERLTFWKEHKLNELLEREQELVNFGEKVLTIMKENNYE